MKDKTVILENPETTREYAQYTWDGFRMFARGGVVLAWRGAKAALDAAKAALNRAEKKEGKNVEGEGEPGTAEESV